MVDYTFYFTFNLGSLSQSGARGGLGARGGQGGLWPPFDMAILQSNCK